MLGSGEDWRQKDQFEDYNNRSQKRQEFFLLKLIN